MTPEARPHVWALCSFRSGESQQIIGLGEALERALGAQLRVLRPLWTERADLLGLARRVSLDGLTPDFRRALGARTPDVLVTASMRNEPISRWFAGRSRTRTITVVLGRSWARPEHFDLVATTPQYRLPSHPNVLENAGTIHRLTHDALVDARQAWAGAYAALPRPRLGLLVGGNSGPYRLGPENTTRLAERAASLAGNGSILGTTSARTPARTVATLQDALGTEAVWRFDASEANPYLGILAWADALLVTGDSIAMTSEAAATGKPVRIFDLGAMADDAGIDLPDQDLSARGYRWLMAHGHPRLTRDLAPAHRALIERATAAGRDVAWDAKPLPTDLDDAVGAIDTTDVDTTVLRIRRLLTARRS